MLVNSKKMLEEAKAGHYAVPAANIVNLENIKGVIEAAEETKHPLMVCEGTEKHTIFILTLIKKKKSIRVFMILVDFLLDKI